MKKKATETNANPTAEQTTSPEQPLYENIPSVAKPTPKPRPNKSSQQYTNVLVPTPLIANISSDILKPVPSIQPTVTNGSCESSQNGEGKNAKPSNSDFDLAWFEEEDDPFEKLERQTINEMEELANVLSSSCNVTTEQQGTEKTESTDIVLDIVDTEENPPEQKSSEESDSDEALYENVQLKVVDLKVNNGSKTDTSDQTEVKGFDIQTLPPVPPRRDLVGKGVLPPIVSRSLDAVQPEADIYSNNVDACLETGMVCSTSEPVLGSADPDATQPLYQNSMSLSQPVYENSQTLLKQPPVPKPPVPKPPRTFTYSRHCVDDVSNENGNEQEAGPSVSLTKTSHSDNGLSVQFSNNRKPEPGNHHGSSDNACELTFVNHHFGGHSPTATVPVPKARPAVPPRPKPAQSPPARPSSGQVLVKLMNIVKLLFKSYIL